MKSWSFAVANAVGGEEKTGCSFASITGVCGLDMNGVVLVVLDVLGMLRVLKSASVGVLLLLRVRAAAVERVCLWHRTTILSS